jgi:hypothetical protein
MKNLIYIFCFYLVAQSLLCSQNLIPNGGFELGPSYSSVQWFTKIDDLCLFDTPMLGPDYWSVLSGSPDRLVENEIHCDWDNSTAQSGNSFINLVYMEAGKSILIEPIKKDTLYHFSSYLKLNTFNGTSNSPNRFYIKFSNTNDSIFSRFINQSSFWEFFDTIFQAKSDATEIEIWANEFVQTGIYIDNLELKKINTNNLKNTDIDNDVLLYPNPTRNLVNIKNFNTNINEINIYDNLHQLINKYSSDYIPETIDFSMISNGIYHIQIVSSLGKSQFWKILKY